MRNKIIALAIIFIAIFSFCSFMACAQFEGEGETEVTQPQTDQYQAFAKNPNPTDFAKLSAADQAKYINQISDYGNGDLGVKNKAIARDFFSKSPDNINSNVDGFKKYMGAEGVNIKGITGDYGAKGISLSKSGVLAGNPTQGKTQSVNINQFKQGGCLAGFDVTINNGEILLNKKGTDQTTSFSGSILNDGTGKIRLVDGSINGMNVKSGQGIEIHENNRLTGTFLAYDGLTFSDLTPIDYDNKNGVFTLHDAHITHVDGDVFIKGSINVDYSGNFISGMMAVKPGDTLSVNGNIIRNTMSTESLLKLPPRGYYDKGDKGPDVAQLQENLASKGILTGDYVKGTYDQKTMDAVSAWQKQEKDSGQYSGKIDGLFGGGSLTAYSKEFGTQGKEVTIGVNTESSGSPFPDSPEKGVAFDKDKVRVIGSGFSYEFAPKSVVDGTFASNTNSKIDLSNAKNGRYFDVGDKGNDVLAIKTMLSTAVNPKTNQPYLDPSSVNNVYDDATKNAVSAWQGNNGLDNDGRFGKLSLAASPADKQGTMTIIPKGGEVDISKDNYKMALVTKGNVELLSGSKTIDIQDGIVYKQIRGQLTNNIDVPVSLDVYDSKGKRVEQVVNTEGPGPLQTIKDFIAAGMPFNQGYFTRSFKEDIHLNSVIQDNINSADALNKDAGIITNTVIPQDQVKAMKSYIATIDPSTDPDTRFEMIVKKAGELTNYDPEKTLKMVSVFGVRYKDLAPVESEGFGNRQTVNGESTMDIKKSIPAMSSKISKANGVPQDTEADKKYRLVTVAGQYLYSDETLKGVQIGLEHSSYEAVALGAKQVIQLKSGRIPAFGSGDLGDVKADWGAVSFGKSLQSNPKQTIQNFKLKDYYSR